MPNWGNLLQIGSAAAGAMPDAKMKWAQVQQEQLRLDAQKRQIAAEAAAFSGLQDGGFGAAPSFGMPGQAPVAPPQVPGGPQMGAPQAPMPGQPSVPAGGGGMPPGAGAPPGAGLPPQGAGPQPQPPMGGPQGGGMTIAQLAQVIKQRNPGIDNATLFEAVKQANALLNPTEKMYLQYLMGQQRLQTTERGQDVRAGTAEQQMRSREQIAGSQIKSREDIAKEVIEGRKDVAGTVEAGKTARQEKSIWARAQAAAKTAEQKAVITQYQLDARQLTAITTRLNALTNAGQGQSPEAKQLTVTRDQLIQRLQDTQKKNPFLPKPAEAIKDVEPDAQATGGATSAKPGTPNVGDVIDGYRFKGGDASKQESWESVAGGK